MTVEIRDASLEARIRKHLQTTGSSSVEEVLLRLLNPRCEEGTTGPSGVVSNPNCTLRKVLLGGAALPALR
jgi:hypothetical protein